MGAALFCLFSEETECNKNPLYRVSPTQYSGYKQQIEWQSGKYLVPECLLQLVNVSVLFFQIADKIAGIKVAAACLANQDIRCAQLAVLPQGFGLVIQNGLQITLCAAAGEIQLLLHLVYHLGSVGSAQRITREITKGTLAPVNILQHAHSIIRYIYTQIFLVETIPGGGQLSHRQTAVQKLLFQFVAHHDVQRISQLVSLRADQTGLYAIYSAVELFTGYTSQIFREQLQQLRPQEG